MNLGIGNLDVGLSIAGIDEYLNSMKVNLLASTEELLDNVASVEQAINAGWQGMSKDKFLEDFMVARSTIKNDLALEYEDVVARFQELKNNFMYQDQIMMGTTTGDAPTMSIN